MTATITGQPALDFAAANGLTLSILSTIAGDEDRTGVDYSDALDVDPALVYLVIPRIVARTRRGFEHGTPLSVSPDGSTVTVEWDSHVTDEIAIDKISAEGNP